MEEPEAQDKKSPSPPPSSMVESESHHKKPPVPPSSKNNAEEAPLLNLILGGVTIAALSATASWTIHSAIFDGQKEKTITLEKQTDKLEAQLKNLKSSRSREIAQDSKQLNKQSKEIKEQQELIKTLKKEKADIIEKFNADILVQKKALKKEKGNSEVLRNRLKEEKLIISVLEKEKSKLEDNISSARGKITLLERELKPHKAELETTNEGSNPFVSNSGSEALGTHALNIDKILINKNEIEFLVRNTSDHIESIHTVTFHILPIFLANKFPIYQDLSHTYRVRFSDKDYIANAEKEHLKVEISLSQTIPPNSADRFKFSFAVENNLRNIVEVEISGNFSGSNGFAFNIPNSKVKLK